MRLKLLGCWGETMSSVLNRLCGRTGIGVLKFKFVVLDGVREDYGKFGMLTLSGVIII